MKSEFLVDRQGKTTRFGRVGRDFGPDYEVAGAGYDTPCWLWKKHKQNQGYGLVGRNGRQYLAHVWYYLLYKGPIPEGKELDHLCRNRACVNPEHLEPITHSENCLRGNTGKQPKLAARRLLPEQVHHIRLSGESSRRLAVRMGVSHETIRCVRIGRHYAEVV